MKVFIEVDLPDTLLREALDAAGAPPDTPLYAGMDVEFEELVKHTQKTLRRDFGYWGVDYNSIKVRAIRSPVSDDTEAMLLTLDSSIMASVVPWEAKWNKEAV